MLRIDLGCILTVTMLRIDSCSILSITMLRIDLSCILTVTMLTIDSSSITIYAKNRLEFYSEYDAKNRLEITMLRIDSSSIAGILRECLSNQMQQTFLSTWFKVEGQVAECWIHAVQML